MGGLLSLFSGGQSASTNKTTQNFTTSSVNTTRDIGLTGQAAVDTIKAALTAGATNTAIGAQSNANVTNLLSNISNNNVTNYKQFVGNTADIVNSSIDMGKNVVNSAFSDVGSSRKYNSSVFDAALRSNANTLDKSLLYNSNAFNTALGDVGKSRTSGNNLVQSALDQATQSAGNVSQSLIKFGTFAIIALASVYALKFAKG